jgi:hypothetical protein
VPRALAEHLALLSDLQARSLAQLADAEAENVDGPADPDLKKDSRNWSNILGVLYHE